MNLEGLQRFTIDDLLAKKGINVIKLSIPEHRLCVDSDSKEMTNFIHPKQDVPAYSVCGKRYFLEFVISQFAVFRFICRRRFCVRGK